MPPTNLSELFWELGFGSDGQRLKRRIAEHLYGDATVEFTVTIYPAYRGPELAGAVLEVKPAPRHRGVAFVIDFPTGQRHRFVVAVPPVLHLRPGQHRPPPVARSGICGPLMPESFDFGRAQWIDGAWPPFVQIFNE